MYINSGYLNNSRTDFKDNSTPLVVGSCGTYRLKTRPKLPTYWQKGRRDYQILYVANGKTHFWFDGREEIVSAGYMVLYKPEEIQKYVYYLEDNPEVFWIHFTGSDVKNILAYHDISLDEHVFYCGVLPDYKALFRKIIQELQLCRYGYEDYIASLFNDILLLVDRQQHEQKKATGNVQEQIERAAAYFNENYNTKISIDDYAESLHISTNWFIHNFKQYAGMSPAQYILSLRMVNAQSLLERTTYNIKEISEIVGYENPLYFSRVFKKEIGKSPAQYRKEAAFLGTIYLWKSCNQYKIWFYVLAILLPSIVEKITLYLFGSFLYNLSPTNIVEVMETIGNNMPYVNFIKSQSAQYLINISFFNWTYIICSIVFSLACVLFLVRRKK